MTRFEQKGVELQEESMTMEEACKAFSYSCKICCEKGIRVDCDRCAISVAHDCKLGYLRTMTELKGFERKPENVNGVFIMIG